MTSALRRMNPPLDRLFEWEGWRAGGDVTAADRHMDALVTKTEIGRPLLISRDRRPRTALGRRWLAATTMAAWRRRCPPMCLRARSAAGAVRGGGGRGVGAQRAGRGARNACSADREGRRPPRAGVGDGPRRVGGRPRRRRRHGHRAADRLPDARGAGMGRAARGDRRRGRSGRRGRRSRCSTKRAIDVASRCAIGDADRESCARMPGRSRRTRAPSGCGRAFRCARG